MSSMIRPLAEDLTDSMPLWPYFLNSNGERMRFPFAPLFSPRAGHRLSVIFLQRRLGIESIDLGQATIQEQKDDVLRLGREVRLFDS